MKVPDSIIEAAIRETNLRWPAIIEHVHLNVKTGHLEATDGNIAVRIPVDCRGVTANVTIPVEAFRAYRKLKRKAGKHGTVAMLVSDTEAAIISSAEPTPLVVFPVSPSAGKFPPVVKAIPTVEGACTIAIDVALLHRVAQALCLPDKEGRLWVRLWIPDRDGGIRVEPYKQEEPDNPVAGVVMPLRR